MKRAAVLLLAILATAGCQKNSYSTFSRKYHVLFSCDTNVSPYNILSTPGQFLSVTQSLKTGNLIITDSNGKKYNTLIYRSDDPDADYSEDEHLIDYPVVYNYLLDLGYNRAGAPYAGNAIFLHCWRGPDSPTGGCVGVSEESMIKILQTVTPGTSVTIY